MKLKQVLINGGFLWKVAVFVFKSRKSETFALVLACGAVCQPATARCPQASIKEYAVVSSVVDGDTIRLADHHLVRLIGVNSPEIHYDGTPSEPLAKTAKDFLTTLLHDHKTVALVDEADTRDRYGRRLAHVFFKKGDSGLVDVQKEILENGMGYWIAIPPNTRYLNCYRSAEDKARRNHLGLWAKASFNLKNAAEKNTLATGFQRLQGKVVAVYRTKKSFWLKFNDRVALRIASKDIHNFKVSALYALKGKNLIARGWLYKHDNMLILPVRIPAAMELIQ